MIQGNFSAATSAADDDDDDYDSDDCDDCDDEENEDEDEDEEDEDKKEDDDNDDDNTVDIAIRADYFVNVKVGEGVCYDDVCVDGEKDEDEETEHDDDDVDDETDEEEEETEEEEEDVVRVESRVDTSKKGEDKDLNNDHTLHEYGEDNILKIDEKHENESCDGAAIKIVNMVESNDASCTYTDVSVRLADAECCYSEEEKGEVKGEAQGEVKEVVGAEVQAEDNTDVDVSVNDVSL